MKYLSYFFKNKNCNITDIDISRNKITGEILKSLTKIEHLQLGNLTMNKCVIDMKTLINLSNINTKNLSLMNNNIDNDLISKLANEHIYIEFVS
jgi:hypothetical protein